MNEIADARQEICAAIYIVGSAVTDDAFMGVLFAIAGVCYMFSAIFRSWNKK